MQCIPSLPKSGIRNLASKEEENRGRRSVNMQILRSTLPLVIFKQNTLWFGNKVKTINNVHQSAHT